MNQGLFEEPGCHFTVESFKALVSEEMENPNIFIMPYDTGDQDSLIRFEKVISCLRNEFTARVIEYPPNEGLLGESQEDIIFKGIAVDSKKTEKIRDIIKEALWPTESKAKKPRSLQVILAANENADPSIIESSKYGVYIPYKEKKYKDIRTHSFNHKPVFYRYRVAVDKVEQLPGSFGSFLQLVFTECPNHLFQKSNFRASARTCDEFSVKIAATHNPEHELTVLARESNSYSQFKSRHENLQKFFLLNDPCTVACEVPLWLEANELKDYERVFNTDDVLTGHVDVLRYEKDGTVGIWDYKPGAARELSASIQVWLYALMLSIRTGICFRNITCGYFDENDLFSFSPSAAEFVDII